MTAKYGPNTAEVEDFLTLLATLTDEQWKRVGDTYRAERYAAWWDAWDAAWEAAYDAAYTGDAAGYAAYAARDAAWDAAYEAAYDAACLSRYTARYTGDDTARAAARDAALALVVRDLISREHFDTLTSPFREVGIDFDTLGKEDV